MPKFEKYDRNRYDAKTKVHPIFEPWKAMIEKCYNPSHQNWEFAGLKGLEVFGAWVYDIDAFSEYIGPRPSMAHFVGRLDTKIGYYPENVVWVTKEENYSRSILGLVLNEDQIAEVKSAFINTPVTKHELHEQYGVSVAIIKRILQGVRKLETNSAVEPEESIHAKRMRLEKEHQAQLEKERLAYAQERLEDLKRRRRHDV